MDGTFCLSSDGISVGRKLDVHSVHKKNTAPTFCNGHGRRLMPMIY